jgi:hypothetical protein
MTIKELKEDYKVYKHDGHIQLWSKTEQGMRMAMKYIWHIKKADKAGYYFVEGFNPTNKLQELNNQIQQHVANLSHAAEYFIPTYRKGLTEELIIHDYMDSIGLSKQGYSDAYTVTKKNIYGYNSTDIKITFWGLERGFGDAGVAEEVEVILWTSQYSWVSVKCKRNVEDIKKGISAILKPLMITESVSLLNLAEKLETTEDVDVMMNQFTGSLQHLKGDMKTHLKTQLLEMAAKL